MKILVSKKQYNTIKRTYPKIEPVIINDEFDFWTIIGHESEMLDEDPEFAKKYFSKIKLETT